MTKIIPGIRNLPYKERLKRTYKADINKIVNTIYQHKMEPEIIDINWISLVSRKTQVNNGLKTGVSIVKEIVG